jgi:hypothetical protein
VKHLCDTCGKAIEEGAAILASLSAPETSWIVIDGEFDTWVCLEAWVKKLAQRPS